MNYGLYLSAAAMRIGHTRLDVLANNMANVNTTSFKPDALVVRSREPAPVEWNLPANLYIPVLDDVGGGLTPDGTYTDMGQGPLVETGQDLDVALQGEGFFAVEVDGEVRYTRDGRFTRDTAGYLATAANGFRVLDESGAPIPVGAGAVRIDATGFIHAEDAATRLGVTAFRNPAVLRKTGKNMYAADASAEPIPSKATLHQRFVEGSGVEPTRALVAMIAAQRSYEAAAKLVQYSDAMLGRAVSDIARLA